MKELLIASVLAIASFPGHAHAELQTLRTQAAQRIQNQCLEKYPGDDQQAEVDDCIEEEVANRSARVTVTPQYNGPPPIGWVYGLYTQCANPSQCSMGVVNVGADGLNVRIVPNGPPVMSLVNGTPLYPLQRDGDWLLVAAACDLTPTWAWSWTAGVPLNRCWVYF
jgi:hypothetical protein